MNFMSATHTECFFPQCSFWLFCALSEQFDVGFSELFKLPYRSPSFNRLAAVQCNGPK